MSIFFGNKFKKAGLKGGLKNPSFFVKKIKSFFAKLLKVTSFNKELRGKEPRRFFVGNFYFGLISLVLFGLLFFNSDSLARLSYLKNSDAALLNSFFKNGNGLENNDLFFSQKEEVAIETPDLKIIQDNFIYGISTPRVLTTQTLGAIFGDAAQDRKDIIDYSVEPGDTVESIAQNFNISLNTLLWANNISKNSNLKVGQSLVILPVSGIAYIVKNGDTLSQIGKTYKANVDDIIAFNSLANEGDIFIGDSLIIPDGVMPQKPVPTLINIPLADNFFIYPAEGKITQGLHYYNGIDLANSCGTPIYAAASGTVQRAVSGGGYNRGMGNYISILHSNGTVTYYGHLMSVFIKSGDRVDVGDRIALMGQTGKATGCHVHFEVIGAQNPLARYAVGSRIQYK